MITMVSRAAPGVPTRRKDCSSHEADDCRTDTLGLDRAAASPAAAQVSRSRSASAAASTTPVGGVRREPGLGRPGRAGPDPRQGPAGASPSSANTASPAWARRASTVPQPKTDGSGDASPAAAGTSMPAGPCAFTPWTVGKERASTCSAARASTTVRSTSRRRHGPGDHVQTRAGSSVSRRAVTVDKVVASRGDHEPRRQLRRRVHLQSLSDLATVLRRGPIPLRLGARREQTRAAARPAPTGSSSR